MCYTILFTVCGSSGIILILNFLHLAPTTTTKRARRPHPKPKTTPSPEIPQTKLGKYVNSGSKNPSSWNRNNSMVIWYTEKCPLYEIVRMSVSSSLLGSLLYQGSYWLFSSWFYSIVILKLLNLHNWLKLTTFVHFFLILHFLHRAELYR